MSGFLKTWMAGAVAAFGLALGAAPAHALGVHMIVCLIPSPGHYVVGSTGRTSGNTDAGSPVVGFDIGPSPTVGDVPHGPIQRYDGKGRYKTGFEGRSCKNLGYVSRNSSDQVIVFVDATFQDAARPNDPKGLSKLTGDVDIGFTSGWTSNNAEVNVWERKPLSRRTFICGLQDNCEQWEFDWSKSVTPTLYVNIRE